MEHAAATSASAEEQQPICYPEELPARMQSPASAVAETAFSLDTFSRFSCIWEHTKLLIGNSEQGKNCKSSNTSTRSGGKSSNQGSPSIVTLDKFLADAQASLNAPQPNGPQNDNIQLLKLLWSATTDVLDKSLDDCDLDLEAAAWGVIGLAAGYTAPSTTSASEEQKFLKYKARLKAALVSLPSLSSPHSSSRSGVSPHQRVFMLSKARREVHICSNMLVQQLRQEGWTSIRWYHGIAVAERWIKNLK